MILVVILKMWGMAKNETLGVYRQYFAVELYNGASVLHLVHIYRDQGEFYHWI